MLVDDVNLEIGNRNADVAAGIIFEIGQRDRAIRDMHRRFRDAIHIDALRLLVAVALEPRAQALELERFAAKDDVAERDVAMRLDAVGLHELPKGGGRLVQHGDPARG